MDVFVCVLCVGGRVSTKKKEKESQSRQWACNTSPQISQHILITYNEVTKTHCLISNFRLRIIIGFSMYWITHWSFAQRPSLNLSQLQNFIKII